MHLRLDFEIISIDLCLTDLRGENEHFICVNQLVTQPVVKHFKKLKNTDDKFKIIQGPYA